MQTDESGKQEENTGWERRDGSEPAPKVTAERFRHSAKHLSPTEDGIQIDVQVSDEQGEKADWSMWVSLEPTSKVTDERLLQREKHSEQMTVTDDGMQTDKREEQLENAESSIRDSFEPGSKTTVASFGQDEKHRKAMTSTDDGIQTNANNWRENRFASRREMTEPDSKLRLESWYRSRTQPDFSCRMPFGIVTAGKFPKCSKIY
jgi:hypothetical protein